LKFVVDANGEVYFRPKVGDVIRWVNLGGKPAEVEFKDYDPADRACREEGKRTDTCTLITQGFFEYKCLVENYCRDPAIEVEATVGGRDKTFRIADPPVAPAVEPSPKNPKIRCQGGQTVVPDVINAAQYGRITWKPEHLNWRVTFNPANQICDQTPYTPSNPTCMFNAPAQDRYEYQVHLDGCANDGVGVIYKAK
jgi:hypothetical protein